MGEDYWSILARRLSCKIEDEEWQEYLKDPAFKMWLGQRGHEDGCNDARDPGDGSP